MGAAEDDAEDVKSPPMRQASIKMPTPLPPRELVSDTNDADDSGAGDTEDAPGTSTEEDRPRSKDNTALLPAEPIPPKREEEVAESDEDDDQETEEEEEDPEARRKRELRERMAKMSGGMGMMGMFGPPGGAAGSAPPRKSRQSTEGTRQSLEQASPEESTRAPPVPIMALPGMSKRAEELVEAESDEEDTAQATPQDLHSKETEPSDDYISRPPKRTSTGRSTASIPQGTLCHWPSYSYSQLTF